jgi:hypothetical protein
MKQKFLVRVTKKGNLEWTVLRPFGAAASTFKISLFLQTF